jgi:hypothetical protein
MANLAIKGHTTRGREVIKLLEMLGGINSNHCYGVFEDRIYIIDEKTDEIIDVSKRYHSDYNLFTLEEFLEKFPYKVGDKVKCWINGYCSISTIEDMQWDRITNEIKYKILDYFYSTMNIQPYKEEIMEEKKDTALAPYLKGEDYSGRRIGYKIPNGYECEYVNKNEIILKPIKPQYPKTYCECCDILGYKASYDLNNITTHDCVYDYKLQMLYRVLICRDAYWKIAGEEMRLKEPWKPDWTIYEYKYCLGTDKNTVINECFMTGNRILAFPTKKMRDIFYENFEDLIEECKEFL